MRCPFVVRHEEQQALGSHNGENVAGAGAQILPSAIHYRFASHGSMREEMLNIIFMIQMPGRNNSSSLRALGDGISRAPI